MSQNNFYWDPDHPESWFSKLELRLSSIEFFDEDFALPLDECPEHDHYYAAMVNLILFVAAKTLTSAQYKIFVERFLSQEKQNDIAKSVKRSQPYISLVIVNCMKKIKKGIRDYTDNKYITMQDDFTKMISDYLDSSIKVIELDGLPNRVDKETSKLKATIISRLLISKQQYIKHIQEDLREITDSLKEDFNAKSRRFKFLHQLDAIISLDLEQQTCYPTYTEARDAAKLLSIKYKKDYNRRRKLDPRLPLKPEIHYAGRGWKNWRTFLRFD